MLGRFFIARPIFAWVLAIGVTLLGVLAMRELPVAQYPNVAPPRVTVTAYYPGAAAEALENSVTQVLEQQLKGLEGLLYFSSSSSADGACELSLTFRQGVNADTAQVQVQNRMQQALGRLPLPVQQQGVLVNKAQSDFLLVLAVADESGRRSSADLSDFLVSTLQDPLSRVDGVGNIQVFGSQYAMRIWLDPYKLAAFGLMPSDVEEAVAAQNTQIAAGELGAQPALASQQLNASVTAQERLRSAEEFRAIVLKTQSNGARVALGDVARVELGSESYATVTRLNGHPASGLAVTLAPGANALSTARAVKQRVAELMQQGREGVQVSYPFDTTAFVEHSIHEVVVTLLEAIVLVALVMYLFLRSWRATLVPMLALPVVLSGTFGVLSLLGYTINTLTLFGMVLAIGLLVDDAIVVVENVERLMHERGLSAREATAASLDEISGALVGIALVLSAVFLPMAFFGGSAGVIYRQFAVTIVSSMLLSALVALTFSPALCATLLRPGRAQRRSPSWPARACSRALAGYAAGVRGMIARSLGFVLLYASLCAALLVLIWRLPTGFLPNEDQGHAIVQFMLPPGAPQPRTLEVARAVERHFLRVERDNVREVFTIVGASFGGSGQNTGMGFVDLAPWTERTGEENRAQVIAARATEALAAVRDAQIVAITPPAVQGLGQSSGFTFQLLDTSGVGRSRLRAARAQLLARAAEDPRIGGVYYNGLEETPRLRLDIDPLTLGALGVAQADVNRTLTAAWGGSYINDFIDRGRVKRVVQQGDADFRASPDDLGKWFVRAASGKMTPLSAVASTRWTTGPATLARFNGVPSYELQGEAAPGQSSGAAMQAMEELARAADGDVGGAWSGLSFEERLSSAKAPSLYALSILVVFLCLAALYESWAIPLSVLLVIPLGVIGTALAATVRGLQNDVFFQVALVTTIGLSAKNAILIVEFAEAGRRSGQDLVQAAVSAAAVRLRPILMTSLAFALGVLPLALATGAGARGRIAIGSGVVGGVLTGTGLTVLFVPMFFVLVRRWVGREASRSEARASALRESPQGRL